MVDIEKEKTALIIALLNKTENKEITVNIQDIITQDPNVYIECHHNEIDQTRTYRIKKVE